jgi:dsRNA-specific ribonuclease
MPHGSIHSTLPPISFQEYEILTEAFLANAQVLLQYNFNNADPLKNAHSQFPINHSEVGKSCQRLEFLGDSVLDILLLECFISPRPNIDGITLRKFLEASNSRYIFTAAALKVGLLYI